MRGSRQQDEDLKRGKEEKEVFLLNSIIEISGFGIKKLVDLTPHPIVVIVLLLNICASVLVIANIYWCRRRCQDDCIDSIDHNTSVVVIVVATLQPSDRCFAVLVFDNFWDEGLSVPSNSTEHDHYKRCGYQMGNVSNSVLEPEDEHQCGVEGKSPSVLELGEC